MPAPEVALEKERQAIRDLILKIPALAVEETNLAKLLGTSTEERDIEGVKREFLIQRKRELIKADELAAFDVNADILYPGALVQGKSLSSGVLSPIGLKRAAGKVVLTTPMGDGKYTAEIKSPSLSEMREAISKLLGALKKPETPARLSFSSFSVKSLSELRLRVGA